MQVTFRKIKSHQPMGEYKRTAIDDRKDTADIMIQYANGGSYTIKSKTSLSGRGVKKDYGQGRYEVTERKLEQLKAQYRVECDF